MCEEAKNNFISFVAHVICVTNNWDSHIFNAVLTCWCVSLLGYAQNVPAVFVNVFE